VVELTNDTLVAETPPSVMVAPLAKFAPVSVKPLPPVEKDRLGLIDDIDGAGGAMYVKPSDSVLVWLAGSGFVTTTSTNPAERAPVVPVSEVESTNDTPVTETPPIAIDAPLIKSVPVIVTLVPPSVEPVVGDIDETAGGSTLTYV
jgi:hypothetical protein